MKSAADRIMAIRQVMQISQEHLARMLGVGVVTVHRWEAGKVPPSLIYLEMIKTLNSALDHGIEPARIEEMHTGSVGKLRFFCKVRQAISEAKEGAKPIGRA